MLLYFSANCSGVKTDMETQPNINFFYFAGMLINVYADFPREESQNAGHLSICSAFNIENSVDCLIGFTRYQIRWPSKAKKIESIEQCSCTRSRSIGSDSICQCF